MWRLIFSEDLREEFKNQGCLCKWGPESIEDQNGLLFGVNYNFVRGELNKH